MRRGRAQWTRRWHRRRLGPVITTPWGRFERRRILFWRIRAPLWLAGAVAGWVVASASGFALPGRIISAVVGAAVACLAEMVLSYGRVPLATASPRHSPETIAAVRAEAERQRHRWDTEAVPSPGGWLPPSRALPAWNWTPQPGGIRPRLERVPAWVRYWYRTPFADRYAHAWMWRHGGWDVLPLTPPA